MYNDRARSLFKGTDSLFYEIQTCDLYHDLEGLKADLDLSSYPRDHPLFSEANRKVPLKLTDELKGAIATEAVFLKPKAYFIAFIQGASAKPKSSAKRVNLEVNKTLHHEKFKSVPFDRLTLKSLMVFLTSEKHSVIVNKINKVALSCFDNKRFTWRRN